MHTSDCSVGAEILGIETLMVIEQAYLVPDLISLAASKTTSLVSRFKNPSSSSFPYLF